MDGRNNDEALVIYYAQFELVSYAMSIQQGARR